MGAVKKYNGTQGEEDKSSNCNGSCICIQKRRKKWTAKAKKDKANIQVYWDANTIKKVPEISKAKNITMSGVRDKLQVSGCMCKESIRYLEQQGSIKRVVQTSKF